MAEIVRTEGVLGGEPRIDGTRIGVLHVYELVVEVEHTPTEIADQLDLSLGEIYSALAYYHEHPEKMREVRRQNAEAEERLAREALEPPEKVT
jgi:uncharacterized protein (DUF433 family)